jgi:hypothetical protein
MAGLTLAQVPGVGDDESVALLPTQTEVALVVMTDGSAFTVIVLVLKQPLEPSEYVIFAVPAVTPVMPPVAVFTLTLPLGLLHVPPVGVAVSVTVELTQTEVGPAGVLGSVFTVTCAVDQQPATV